MGWYGGLGLRLSGAGGQAPAEDEGTTGRVQNVGIATGTTDARGMPSRAHKRNEAPPWAALGRSDMVLRRPAEVKEKGGWAAPPAATCANGRDCCAAPV